MLTAQLAGLHKRATSLLLILTNTNGGIKGNIVNFKLNSDYKCHINDRTRLHIDIEENTISFESPYSVSQDG